MIKGEVTSGDGKASEFLQLKPYRNFIRKQLGFKPFAGTLNLKVNPEAFRKFKEEISKVSMEKTEYEGRELGGITIFPVEFEGEKAALVEADRSRYGDEIAEIVAADSLRAKMDLEDGEIVEIESR